jgi:hypothetical protein
MPLIPYTPQNFAAHHGNLLQQSQDLDLSWAELIWAAISVGRAELFHVVRYGDYSLFEISYRTAILFANLRELETELVTRSEAYDGLDPSEKGAISYFLGMTLTKAAVHRLCNVPWLMHLDVYRAELAVALSDDRSRPDLVGRDELGRWVVVESKGRTNSFDGRALERAKQQAQKIMNIGGQAPHLAIGILVHFDGDILQLHLRDPEPDVKAGISLPLSSESFFEGYYRPFREWLRGDPSRRRVKVGERTFIVALIESLDLSVGLDEALAELPASELARAEAESISELTREQLNDVFVGADGILVRTGTLWSSSNMRQQPQERTRAR